MATPCYIIRAAEEADLPAISDINKYYALNTVMTFAIEPRTLDDFISTYESIKSEDLPYIVAADGSSPTELIGYASASQFRGTLGAYEHTVEISLFCHPEHQGKGLGTRLLRTLLGALRDPVSHSECFPAGSAEGRMVKQVLAVMAVDEAGKGQGLKLKEFYEREGFTLNGHLRRVGFKFGLWIDTMYLQQSL